MLNKIGTCQRCYSSNKELTHLTTSSTRHDDDSKYPVCEECFKMNEEFRKKCLELLPIQYRHGPIEEKVILIFPWEEAPPQYRELFSQGGDEDWLAIVPPNLGWINWLDHFGSCVTSYQITDGWIVYVSAHA